MPTSAILEAILELFWRHFPPNIHHLAHTKNTVFSRVFSCFGRFMRAKTVEKSIKNLLRNRCGNLLRKNAEKRLSGGQGGSGGGAKICPKIDLRKSRIALRKSRKKDAPREPLKARQGPKYAQKCGFGGPFRVILETFSTKHPSPSAYEKHSIFTCFYVFLGG